VEERKDDMLGSQWVMTPREGLMSLCLLSTVMNANRGLLPTHTEAHS
jgi:hypothetical protein